MPTAQKSKHKTNWWEAGLFLIVFAIFSVIVVLSIQALSEDEANNTDQTIPTTSES